MNVYDFDKTIYDGDCTLNYYFYCLKKYPKILLCLPRQVCAAIKYKLGKLTKTEFKEEFYCFFYEVKDISSTVEKFWDIEEKKIKKWYLECKQKDDVIISASPDFLIQEACRRLEVTAIIASKVNCETGKYQGINCYGEEKVKRFYAIYPERTDKIDCFYSDSYSDLPMARIAEKAFLVKKNKVEVWKV